MTGWRVSAAIAVLVACFALGTIAASRSNWYEGTDFDCLWSGARLVAERQDPYDEAVWVRAAGRPRTDARGELVATSSCALRYSYPLWTAIAMVPFGVLPLPVASVTWLTLSLVASSVGAAASWRAAEGRRAGAILFTAIVLTAQPLWLLLISGQLSGIALGLAGLSALWLARREDLRAGVGFGLLALKPQLIALCGPALFIWGLVVRRRAALAAAAVVIALLVVSIAIAPSWPLEWLAEMTGHRLRIASLLPTAWGLSADLFGTVLVAPALIAAVTGGAWYLARRRATPVGVGAIALAISLFGTPHAWSYDHLVLVLPWAHTLAIAARNTGAARVTLLLGTAAVASLLPWILYALAFSRGTETLNALVPALTALLVAAAIRSDIRPAYTPTA
jgi:hypothetical protein